MKTLRGRYLQAGVVFLVALVFRLVYFVQLKNNFPAWNTLILDERFHHEWAQRIAAGQFGDGQPFFRAPFYGFFLGAIYRLFGPEPAVARIIQHVIGAGACAMVFLLASRFWGRRHAWTASLVCAVCWILPFFEDQLLLDSLLVPLAVGLVWLLLDAIDKQRTFGFVVAGAVWGLAAITRPTFLVLALPIGFWLFSVFPGRRRGAVRVFGLLLSGLAVFVLPVTLYNTIVGRDLVLVSSQGGVNFYIGNNPQADGCSAVVPELGPTWTLRDCELLVRMDEGRDGRRVKPSAVSGYFYRKGIEFILRNPGAWLRLTAKKVLLVLQPHEITNNRDPDFLRRYAGISAIAPNWLYLVSPLSLIGIFVVLRGDGRQRIIALVVITYALTISLFFVNSRFRLPLIPMLAILASVGGWRLVELARSRRFRSLSRYGVFLLALVVLIDVDWFGVSAGTTAKSHYSLGLAYYQEGRPDLAMREFNTALRLEPSLPNANLARGTLFFEDGRMSDAKDSFRRELAVDPRNSDAMIDLSVLAQKDRAFADALAYARRAVATAPFRRRGRIQELSVLEAKGDHAAAKARAEEYVDLFPADPAGHYFLGKVRFETGDADGAKTELVRFLGDAKAETSSAPVIRDLYSKQERLMAAPGSMRGRANYLLGLIAAGKGDFPTARRYLETVVKLVPDDAEAWSDLGVACDRLGLHDLALSYHAKAIGLRPDNPVFLFNRGTSQAGAGLVDQARESFRAALVLDPNFRLAREYLDKLPKPGKN